MMGLEALIADAKRRKGLKRPKRSKAETGDDQFKRTKEYLRQLKLDACIPESVHLKATHQTCACGEEYQCINQWPLVKKVSKTLTHFEAYENINEFSGLPRFTDVIQVKIPFCEVCFVKSTYTWEEVDVVLEATPPLSDN